MQLANWQNKRRLNRIIMQIFYYFVDINLQKVARYGEK